MKKIKLYRQKDAMDCGPSCLAMIAQYYGRKIDVNKVRLDCDLSKGGVSLLGISRAAENLGFHTVGGILSLETLSNDAQLPVIVHWEQDHFIVVYRIKGNGTKTKIWVADPDTGFKVYSFQKFLDGWASSTYNGEDAGIALLLEPTSLFYQQEDKHEGNNKRFHILKAYSSRYISFFVQIIVGLLIGSIIQLIIPFLTQSLVDTGINGKDLNFVWLVLLAELMLLFSSTAISLIRSKILLHVSTRINVSLISDFFIKLMRLPMKFFDTKLMGDLMQRIEDHKRVQQFLTSNSLDLIFSFFTFVVFGVILAVYNWIIFLVFIIGIAIYTVWICLFIDKRKKLDYKYFDQASKDQSITYQLINGMQEIKLQGCQQRKRWEWEDNQAEIFHIKLDSLNMEQIQKAGSIAINELKNMIITIIAAASVINNDMTLGMMLAVQYIIGQLNSPVEQLVRIIYAWQDVCISLDRMNDIQDEPDEDDKSRTETSISIKEFEKNGINIKNVDFSYSRYSKQNILNDISIHIPANKVTAIVGASGSGKTTLVKLLLGYYKPQNGTITIGDKNLNTFNLAWWRSKCGAVMQEGYIFNDTIANNIAISDDQPNLERVKQAAKAAQIADYIDSLPLGYNTIIGQDGMSTSLGQKQRILIARVIYKNPKFVFLDEATNSLDTKNEKEITSNLSKFYEGKTVIIVAHRLSTVRDADQILVLNFGKVIEKGTHDELILKRGKYYELIKNQLELGN